MKKQQKAAFKEMEAEREGCVMEVQVETRKETR